VAASESSTSEYLSVPVSTRALLRRLLRKKLSRSVVHPSPRHDGMASGEQQPALLVVEDLEAAGRRERAASFPTQPPGVSVF
jgi:hypothetical protein